MNEILIYEDIGEYGVSAKSVAAQLKEMGDQKEISVRINSPGGSVFEGSTIYNLLKNNEAKVTVYIDGLCASIASVIAMAADQVVMADNALMMIHDPWSLAIGNADELRREADVLDKVKESLVTTYVARTGMSRDEISTLLKDETWLDAEEAIEFGFADASEEPKLVAAQIRKVINDKITVPKGLLPEIPKKEAAKNGEVLDNGKNSNGVDPKAKGEKVMTQKVDIEKVKQEVASDALAADKKRRDSIASVFDKFEDQAGLMRTCQDDQGCTVEAAQAKLLDALGANEAPSGGKIETVADSADKFREGATNALFARAGYADQDLKNEFRGFTLTDIARNSLERSGQSVSRMSRMDIVAAAFTHSTSDFGSILSNVANKSMLKGWDEAEETFELFTAKGSLPDFKAATRVDLGAFPSLRQVRAGAEYKHVTLSDRGETIQLASYGELFSINRQAIINDDLGLFSTVPRRFGRAAKRTVGDLVFAVINDNGAMSDGTALFHEDHKNLVTAAAPSTAAFDAMRVKMALQQDPDANVTALNIRPKYVLAPVGLEGTCKTVVKSETEIAASQANSKKPNSVQGLAEVISDARLDAASSSVYYMVADANMFDTIEVAYLDGVAAPFLDQTDGWTIDGSDFKVRIDAGVKALDFRGMVKNPYAG